MIADGPARMTTSMLLGSRRKVRGRPVWARVDSASHLAARNGCNVQIEPPASLSMPFTPAASFSRMPPSCFRLHRRAGGFLGYPGPATGALSRQARDSSGRKRHQQNALPHQKIFLQKRFLQKDYPFLGQTIFGQVFGRGGMSNFQNPKVPPTGGLHLPHAHALSSLRISADAQPPVLIRAND
jgi:hypothetical protein